MALGASARSNMLAVRVGNDSNKEMNDTWHISKTKHVNVR